MLNHLKVRTRLLTGFLSVALLVAVMGYFGVRGVQQISDSFDAAANYATPALRALLEIKSAASEIEAQTVGFELIGDEASREEGSLTGSQKYALIARVEKIDTWAERYERAEQYEPTVASGGSGEHMELVRRIELGKEEVVKAAFEFLELKERGISGRELLERREDLVAAQRTLREVISAAIEEEVAYIQRQNETASSVANSTNKLNILISAVTLAAALAIGLTLSRSIATPIRLLAEMVERVGKRPTGAPVTMPVESRDEIGQLSRAFSDMTERLDKTTVSRDALAEEVAERRRAEEALAAQAHKLRRTNAELAQFLSVASHDLREPLRKVRTFGDLLARKSGEGLSDEGRDYVSRMKESAQHMQALVDDLATFSRVTTRQQRFALVDVRHMAQQVLADLEAHIQRSGAHVELEGQATVEADPAQMRLLLLNLLSNALKFGRPGEAPHVRVHSSILDQEEDGSAGLGTDVEICQIRVEDNGIGFDEKYLDRIFAIFQRLHGRDDYEGTGVGLAICQKVVDRHGGHITAWSTPGLGSTFIVTLPAAQGAEEARRIHSNADVGENYRRPQLRGIEQKARG